MGLTTGNSVVLTGLAIELDVANPKSYAVFGGAKGYALGGQNSTTNYTTAEKITYSNDTTAAQTTANLSAAKQSATGCSEGNTKGYTLGGYVVGNGAYTTTTEKTFYSSDVTTTATSANSSVARGYQCSISTYNNKGYICGGFSGSSVQLSTIDYIYFSNDVTSAQTTTTLTVARAQPASLSLPNIKGYILGGNSSGGASFYATTEKITYSTDALAAQTSANLTVSKSGSAGVSDCSTKGYVAGGSTASGGAVTGTTDKLTFSTDTTAAQTTANLSSARSDMAYPSQGSTKGYFMGGFTNSSSCIGVVTSDKITFTTDTTAAQSSANISVARGLASSLDNIYSQTISDISGGVNNATINNFPTYSRDNSGCLVFNGSIDYPNTVSVAANSSYAFGTGDFTYEVWFNAASFASSNNYILDLGVNSGNLQYYSGRLSYYNSTIGSNTNLATKGLNLIPNNWYHVIITRLSGTTYMYANGNLITSNADTHNYSSPSVTIGNYGGGGKYSWNGKIALFRLYSGKGFSATEVLQNYNATKNRFLVPSPVVDSSLVLNLDASNRLSFSRYGGSKAYFSGGSYSANSVTTDKLTYSNDTTTAQTSANLPSNHGYGTPLSDGYSKGYVCGDYPTTVTTDKVTYSTETAAAVTTANLSQGRGFGTGLSDYRAKGFILGGYNNYANADKITFANDIASAVTSAQLGTAKFNGAQRISDGSDNGYYLGGASGSDVVQSAIQKIVYSTEVTSTISNSISLARHLGGGNSAFSYKGYICGGYTGPSVYYAVNADRFTYINESSSALSSANLSLGRYGVGSASEGATKGFVVGGYSTGSVLTADKITYATEITSAQPSANLTGSRYMPCGLEEIYNVSSTIWFDTTTSNNSGTLTNGPTYDLIQPAIIFDGTNDYVENSSPNLGITGNATATFSCWFYYSGTSSSTFNALFGYGNGSNSGDTFALGLNPSGTYRVSFEFNGGNSVQSYDNAYIPNSWNYFVGTKTPGAANTTTKLYINGVPLSIASATLITPNVSSRVIRAGRWINDGSPSYFTGKIAYCSIYNRELNISEILQNYSYYVNRLAIAAIGSSRDYPAPSGVAIKQVNPYAQTGWYWLSVGGTTSQFWIDMDYDGGGWVLVINNRAGNGAMPNVTYVNATTQNINSTGSYGTASGDYTPANFNLWAGLTAWKNIADATAGSNTVVMFVSTAYKTLADINNHTKRARFTWTGWSGTYAWQGAASYVNEKGSTTAGLWAYHIANGYSLSTYDVDQDVSGTNCSTTYGNSPWWFGACWDGFYFPNGGGYGDFINWAGAGTDLHNYGAIYIR